ncbi:MAG: glycosyltransferase [Armatimonadia bacterium]
MPRSLFDPVAEFPVRIAIFTNTYWPTVNGVAISIRNLREGLNNLGHEVHVLAPAPRGFDLGQDEPLTHRFLSVPAPVKADYPLAVPISPHLRKALGGLKFDLIHTHHPMWVGVWGQWFARRQHIPIVTTIHTQYEIYSELIPLPDAVINAFLRNRVITYCNRCHIVTTPAESSKQRLLSRGVTTPIEVVYNPTDLTACREADGSALRRQLGCGEGDPLLGYIGRLAPEKNLHALLDAADIILPQMSRARLVLVGDGPSRTELEQRVKTMKHGDRISFAGRVEHDQVPVYDAALDLFVTPSMFEVQPLSFAEAMAAGTPVIAMDAPGANDMIEDGCNGRLVPTSEQGAGLARAALETLNTENRLAEMSQRSRDWARRYDLPSVVERVLQVYDKALARAGKRG